MRGHRGAQRRGQMSLRRHVIWTTPPAGWTGGCYYRDIVAITRREFLTKSGCGAAAGALAVARRSSAGDAVKIGQQPLNLGSDRDGLLVVPHNYKPDMATPLVV